MGTELYLTILLVESDIFLWFTPCKRCVRRCTSSQKVIMSIAMQVFAQQTSNVNKKFRITWTHENKPTNSQLIGFPTIMNICAEPSGKILDLMFSVFTQLRILVWCPERWNLSIKSTHPTEYLPNMTNGPQSSPV